MHDVFTISSPALPKATRVVGFRGSEGISRLYAFELHLALAPGEADAFELPGAVGGKGTLVLDRQDGRAPFTFHGIFSEAALVHHEPDGRAFLRALLVPRLWRLTQTYHSRIFTQQSIPDILKKTLEDGGLTSDDFTLQLTGQYAPEEHVCQYRESGFDFFSRWMEREGLYYFFEQGDDGEKLIIADDKSAHENLDPGPVRFFAALGHDVSAGEHLNTFVCRQRALPASVRLKDYDHTKPALDVSGTASVSSAGAGEISVHGARFFTPEAGKRLARLRAQEMLAREQVFTGSGTAFYLRAGYTFDLHDHPRAAFDTTYLVTEAEHFCNQSARTPEMLRVTGLGGIAEDEVYRVEVTAIPAAVQFRAEPRAGWPRIYGTEHGTVDGEADSDYAQLDDHGRYLVRFAFDESDLGDGKASTRVRMMQPHGGDVEGWHFPLRKGTEVLLTFLGGDPDRPVIAGVVPNTEKPSPVTKANQTRNVIQTGGHNRLEIEDKKGFERITLTTPYADTMLRMGSPNADHEMITSTAGSALHKTGKDWDVKVRGNLTEEVTGAVHELYETSLTTTILGPQKETITGGVTQNISSGWHQTVTGGGTQVISGGYKRTVTGGMITTVGPYVEETVDGNKTTLVNCDENHIVSGTMHMNYGPWTGNFASATWEFAGPVSITTPAWDITTPTHIETTPLHFEITGINAEAKGLSHEVTGVSVEATMALIEGVEMHVETTGLHLEAIGLHVELVAVHAANEPIKCFNHAMEKISAALHVFG
jgi:type VI secretion system secreted protein VgrG